MRRKVLIIYLFFLCGIITGCKDKEKTEAKESIEKSIEIKENADSYNIIKTKIIDHSLGFEIVEFSSKEISKDKYNLAVKIETENIELLNNDYFFFIHFYSYNYNDELDFLNGDIYEAVSNKKSLIFQRQLETEILDFEKIKFGLVNKNDRKRYFEKTIHHVSIKP